MDETAQPAPQEPGRQFYPESQLVAKKDHGHLAEEHHLGEQSVKPHGKKQGSIHSVYRKSPAASLIFALLVSAALAALTPSPALWVLFVGLVAFMLLYTGRTARWRSVMFISMAWIFVFNKLLRGLAGFSYFMNYEEAFLRNQAGKVPNCHIAIGSSILNYAYQQYLALKSGAWSDWGPLSLGFLWLLIPLIFGQAWCSWGCFYGGLDDGFSRIFSKPRLRWFRLPGPLRDLPAAILVFGAIISVTTMLPIFCLWLCPLKLTDTFLDANDSVRRIQFILFVSIGIGAVIILPILTKRRVFCSLICPFGAWQAFVGRLNPVRVTIDPGKCTGCQRCYRVCPTFAIDLQNLKDHTIGPYCNGCGQCIDDCPDMAIRYTVFGKDIPSWPGRGILHELLEARVMFLFAYLLLGGAIGSLCLY